MLGNRRKSLKAKKGKPKPKTKKQTLKHPLAIQISQLSDRKCNKGRYGEFCQNTGMYKK